ncbi:MAG: hypothetical protein RL521_281 [Bacteroidota bacterium]|jgi:TM2 domain-containing membrane protein YozV
MNRCWKTFLNRIVLLIFLMSSAFAVQASIPYKGLKYWSRRPDNVRGVAIALDCTLGFFGVHRMYLGTDPKVPVFYTLSMGGGGLLWLVDLGVLISHKDISPYMNNPHMFMWAKKEDVVTEEESLPPVSE